MQQVTVEVTEKAQIIAFLAGDDIRFFASQTIGREAEFLFKDPYKVGNVLEAAFQGYFGNIITRMLKQHAGMLKTLLVDPFFGSAVILLLKIAFKRSQATAR